MTDLLEKAVATARRVPPDVQDEMARVPLDLAGDEQPACQLSPEEGAEQDEADGAEARGDPRRFVALNHVEAVSGGSKPIASDTSPVATSCSICNRAAREDGALHSGDFLPS